MLFLVSHKTFSDRYRRGPNEDTGKGLKVVCRQIGTRGNIRSAAKDARLTLYMLQKSSIRG